MGLAPRPERVKFKGMYEGQTVYVLGSGASLNWIDARFFTDKLCVAVNFISLELGVDVEFIAGHYHLDAIAISEALPDQTVIVPEMDQGGTKLAPHAPTSGNVWSFPTREQMYEAFNVDEHWPTEPDHLVVGPTSLHFAMHFAAYVVGPTGAVVLVGADCGRVDGKANRDGHDPGTSWPWDVWAEQLPRVADRIRATGTQVFSLNPFVNFALEGHSYRSTSVNIN